MYNTGEKERQNSGFLVTFQAFSCPKF